VAEPVEGAPGDGADDFAENNKIDVAVAELRAGGGQGSVGHDVGEGGGEAFAALGAGDAGAHSGGVSEEVADGDLLAAGAGEFREVHGDRIVEIEEAAFVEEHDGGGRGDDLGERGGVVNRADGGGGGLREQGAVAEGLVVEGAAVFEPEDAAGDLLCGDVFLNGAVDLSEFGGVEGGGGKV